MPLEASLWPLAHDDGMMSGEFQDLGANPAVVSPNRGGLAATVSSAGGGSDSDGETSGGA